MREKKQLPAAESIVDKSSRKPMVNETVKSIVGKDDHFRHDGNVGGKGVMEVVDDMLDVKPDVDALDLVFRNNIKNIGLKTYENAYEGGRIGRKILATETNIIDI